MTVCCVVKARNRWGKGGEKREKIEEFHMFVKKNVNKLQMLTCIFEKEKMFQMAGLVNMIRKIS